MAILRSWPCGAGDVAGSSGVRKLQAGAGAFHRGGVDSFRLQLPALGALQQLELSRTAEGQQQVGLVELCCPVLRHNAALV